MFCPTCHGNTTVPIYRWPIMGPRAVKVGTQVCPTCQGHGSVFCCDGLREQPEPESELINGK